MIIVWQQLTVQYYFNPGGYSINIYYPGRVGLKPRKLNTATRATRTSFEVPFFGNFLSGTKLQAHFHCNYWMSSSFFENLQSIISTLKSVHGPIPNFFLGFCKNWSRKGNQCHFIRKGKEHPLHEIRRLSVCSPVCLFTCYLKMFASTWLTILW